MALVTGASRGIGAACARLLASHGARVHVCSRDVGDLTELVKAWPDQIVAHEVDVAKPSQVDAMCAAIRADAGRLDVVIHNASMLGPMGPLITLDDDAWRATIDVNLHGAFAVTRATHPLLTHGTAPLLIHMSSSVGRAPRAQWGAYSVSKCGVEAIVAMASQEWRKDGICVVSLNPGGTATDMRANAYPDEDPATLPTPEQVAATIGQLAASLTLEQTGGQYNSRELFVR